MTEPRTLDAGRGQGVAAALGALAVATAIGLAVRAVYAWAWAADVAEWEADVFVTAWHGRPWEALNRMRAPGGGLAWGRLVEVFELGDILRVRLASVVVSLLALLAAVDLAVQLGRSTEMRKGSWIRAAAWMALVWAVHPTLVAASITPTPELVVGASGCWLLACALRRTHQPGLVSWLAFAVAAAVWVACGGIVAAAVLAVGLLVYLAPVPRLGVTLATLIPVGAALAAGFFVQRGPDVERPWVTDSAWAYSMKGLLDSLPLPEGEVPLTPAQRERELIVQAGSELQRAGVPTVARAWLGRLTFDLLGPGRFEALAPPALAERAAEPVGQTVATGLSFWDVFLRGGLLLFALTVLGLARAGGPSRWPRAGAVVALIVWFVLCVAGTVGPNGLAAFDLVLLGCAGAGLLGADPRRAWTRRLAFLVGGGLLCSLVWTGGMLQGQLSDWTRRLTHRHGEGGVLVQLVTHPFDFQAEVRMANLLLQSTTPLLRHPEIALDHALQAAQLATTEEETHAATKALVRAQVECGLFESAAQLAEGAHAAASPEFERDARVLLQWVQEAQRRARGVPRR